MPAARIWRLRAPTTSTDGYLGIATLKLFDAVGGPDLAQGKTASASAYLGGYEPSKAFDGNNASFYTTGGASPITGGHYLQVDLGAAYDIIQAQVTVRPDQYREDPTEIRWEYFEQGSWIERWSNLAIPAWVAGETRTFDATAEVYSGFTKVGGASRETLATYNPNARVAALSREVLHGGNPAMRVGLVVRETFRSIEVAQSSGRRKMSLM